MKRHRHLGKDDQPNDDLQAPQWMGQELSDSFRLFLENLKPKISFLEDLDTTISHHTHKQTYRLLRLHGRKDVNDAAEEEVLTLSSKGSICWGYQYRTYP